MKRFSVRNADGDTREVNEDKIHLAERDGYLPVVSNGLRETRVQAANLSKASGDGFAPLHEVRKAEGDATVQADRAYERKNSALGKTTDFLSSASAMMDENNPITGLTDRAKAGINALTSDESYDQSLKDIRADRDHEMGKSKAGRGAGYILGLGGNIAAQAEGKAANAAIGFGEGVARSRDMLSLDALQNGVTQATLNVGVPMAFEALPAVGRAIKGIPATIKGAAEGLAGNGRNVASVASEGFKEGAKEAKKIPIVGEGSFGVGELVQSAGGAVSAAKSIVEQHGNKKEFKFMVDEFRKHLGPGTRHSFEDEDIVSQLIMKDGPNQAKEWLAEGIASTNGIAKEHVLTILNKAPERTREERLFNKMDAGESMVDDVKNAYTELKDVTGKQYDQLRNSARNQFTQLANEPVLDVYHAINKAKSKKSISGNVHAVLDDIYEDLIGSGDKAFDSLSAPEQFDRILEAKQAAGEAVKWASKTELPKGQQILMDVNKKLGAYLKKFEDMQSADAAYSAFKGVETSLFKPMANVRRGNIVDFDNIKLEKIFGQSDSGRRLLQQLDKAKELLATGKLSEGQAASVSTMIKNIEGLVETAEGKRALESFRQSTGGPSSPAIDRLGANIRKDSFLESAFKTPETFFRRRENIADLAPTYFGKAYKEMNEAEQIALIKFHAWHSANEKAVPAVKLRALEEIKKQLGAGLFE